MSGRDSGLGATDEEIIEDLREEVAAYSAAMVAEDRRANKAEREVATLRQQAEAMRAVLQRYASECGECNGHGYTEHDISVPLPRESSTANITQIATRVKRDCRDCRDIRALLTATAAPTTPGDAT